VAALPETEARGSAVVGVFDGKVVLAGGLKQIQLVSPFAQDTVDTVSMYDVRKDKWVDVPSSASKLPDTRDHACAAVIDGKFYVFGGRERGQLSGKKSVPVLDLKAQDKGWMVGKETMPTPRAGLACGVIEQRIHIWWRR